MRKTALGILVWVVATGSLLAVEPQVSRITYFPLSYTRYHNLKVDTLEVGVGRRQYDKNRLGKPDLSSSAALSASTTTIQGTLALNNASAFEGPASLAFGSPQTDNSRITFENNLRVGDTAKLKNLNIMTLSVETLRLGDAARHQFPTCTEAGSPENGDNVYWAQIRLKTDTTNECKWHLTCGFPTNADNHCKTKGTDPSRTCNAWANAPYNMVCAYGQKTGSGNTTTNSNGFFSVCCNTPEYKYNLKNRALVGQGEACSAACTASTNPYSQVGTNAPDELDANFFTPVCNEANTGHECYLQSQSGGQYYCHRYVCGLPADAEFALDTM